MQDIIQDLTNLRGRSRALLLLQRISVLVALVLGVLLVLGTADFLMRFPATFRFVLLLLGLAGLSWGLWRYLWPVLRFSPPLTEVALRVERSLPGLSGRLASSVEFAASGMSKTNELAARSVSETQSRMQSASLREVINLRQTKRDVGALFLVAIVCAVVGIASPSFASTTLSRILAPYGSAEWPARTGVASLMTGVSVHARGVTMPLRAQGTKAPRGAIDDMDITASYRYEREGRFGEWRTITLTSQGEGRYERLVETDADAIEFYFESYDARTNAETIFLTPPPAVKRATLSVTPPAYAQAHQPALTYELGPGVDERAVTETASLHGSEAVLQLELNKPIPVPSDAPSRERWIASTFGWEGSARPVVETENQFTRTVTLSWRMAETRSLHIDLADEYGLHNIEDIAYRIDVVDDRVPTVTITQPESDEAVLATAVVPVRVEARDDIAVSGLGLTSYMHEPGVEASSNRATLTNRWDEADSPTAELHDPFDLGALSVKEGDVIELYGVANDGFELDGMQHEPVHSPIRRLRVISERDFGESLFQELKALRQNAIRLEAQQAELQDDIIESGVQPGIERAQERVSERLAEQLDSLQRVRDRVDMNQFDDSQIEALVDSARDLLEHAGRASSDASERISERQAQQRRERTDESTESQPAGESDRGDDTAEPGEQNDANEQNQPGANEPQDQAAQDRPQNDQPSTDATEEQPAMEELELPEAAPEDQPIVESQQEVRDELRDLIEALDRNEDTWVMNQRIRELLDQQTQLQAQTQQMSNQTRGRSRDELEQAELSELDRIAMQQRDLAEQLRELIDELRDRSDQMEEVDPAAAEGQRRAADTAEQRGTDRRMDSAAQQAQQNQLQNAQNSQQQARNDLQQMLEELDRNRARAEELQRQMASLIQSIERLIVIQEEELSALARAEADENFSGRDRAMIRLNQNTQAVSGEARAAGAAASRIARALDRAADAQGSSIGFLRADPIDPAGARTAEERSLELLREAKALAEELEQQAQEEATQQKREELMKAYADLMEREMSLRGDTEALARQGELDRRALVEARRYSNLQEEIRQSLDDIRTRTQEVSDSIVFSHVHGLMDQWSREVSDGLRDGLVTSDVTDRQLAIADSLSRLIKALEEEQKQSEFEQSGNSDGGQGQGQGSSQPQPLVPPIAELKLLRGLQEQIYDRTRTLDQRGDLDDAARRQRLRELGREQDGLLQLGEEMMQKLSPSQQPSQEGGENPRDGQPPGGSP